jgi:hypothetical protein
MTLSDPEQKTSAAQKTLSDDRQKLTPQTVRAFVAKLHTDPDLKAKVIASLDTKGFAAMVEEFFAPTEHQKKLLEGHKNSPEMEQIARAAIRNALTTGGTIDVVHTDSEIERTSVSIGVGFGGVGINVTVEC